MNSCNGDGRTLLGYVLSRSTTSSFNFLVTDNAEQQVSEGQYVIVNPKSNEPIVGFIDELYYFHEFYEEGDVWTEAIRRRSKPPATVARKYLRAKVNVIGVPKRMSQIIPPPRPPPAGSEVCSITGKDLQPIFTHDPSDKNIPKHLLSLGTLYGYAGEKLNAFIDLRAITMHMSVIGTTGSGKTNTVSVLIEELGNKQGVDTGIVELPRTIPMIIVDINADYVPYYDNPDIVPSYTTVYRLVSKISRAYKEPANFAVRSKLWPILMDLNVFSHDELAEIIVSLYKGKPDESTILQESYLRYKLNKERLEEEGNETDYNELFRVEANFNDLLRSIESDVSSRDKYPLNRATSDAVKRQIDKFRSTLLDYQLLPSYSESDKIFNDTFVNMITEPDSPCLVIVDLSIDGFPGHLEAKQFVVFYISKLLFNVFKVYRSELSPNERRVLIFAIEEAQNFIPNLQQYAIGTSLGRKDLMTIATQGRKFGLSLVLITQRPIYVDPLVMSMMNTFVIHRVPAYDVRFVQQVTGGLPSGVSKGLTTMEKGKAIIVGQMNPPPNPTIAMIRRRKVD